MEELVEENKLLTLMAREDAAEMRRLRVEAETAAIEKAKLAVKIDEMGRTLRQQQEEIFTLANRNFSSEVQSRTLERETYASRLRQAEEEQDLLQVQSTLDTETIRNVQRALQEALYERDQLASSIDAALHDRDDALVQSGLLEEHADQLRRSNVTLAARVAELEETILIFEREDYADWFQRKSK